MEQLLRKFYDTGTGSGTGGTFTLADLNAGDGATNPTDLAAAQAKAEAEKAAAEKTAKEAADKAQGSSSATEGVNEDGSLQEGYIKDESGKVVKDPNFKPAEAGDEGDIDPAAFWEDVNKRHGWELTVEYPEGVDPLSPEGVYYREKAVANKAADDFEAYLKKTDPRGYAYMLHRQAGGSDEEFFSNKTFSLPEYDTFKENVDIQTAVYRESLRAKGLDDDTIQLVIDKAIKDNKLFDVSNTAYKAVKKEQEDQLAAIEQRRVQNEQEYQRSVSKLSSNLNDLIVEGKGINLVIPDTDKQPFLDFVKGKIQVENGKFVIVQPVDTDIARQMESLYFLYKKGNLKELIAREAKTQNTQRLGKQLQKSRTETKTAGGEGPSKNFIGLGQL